MAKKSKVKKKAKAPSRKAPKAAKKKAAARSSLKGKKPAAKVVAPKKPSGPPFPIKTPARVLRPLDENIKPAKPPKFSATFNVGLRPNTFSGYREVRQIHPPTFF